jgi:hypothetical protein
MAIATQDLAVRVQKAIGLGDMKCREFEIRFSVDEAVTVNALCYVEEEHGNALVNELEWREFLVEMHKEPPRVREIVRRKDRTWRGWFRWVVLGKAE